MKKYFTVLQDNSLKRIIVEEQKTTEVLAIKQLEKLKYKLITHDWEEFTNGYAYNWKCIESGDKYCVFETKGKAIEQMLKDGFTVSVDGTIL